MTRHTASTVTDDALDELYLERDVLADAVAKLTGCRPGEVVEFARKALAEEREAVSAPESRESTASVAESTRTADGPHRAV